MVHGTPLRFLHDPLLAPAAANMNPEDRRKDEAATMNDSSRESLIVDMRRRYAA